MRQLPVEGKRYQTMDRIWRKIMSGAKADSKVNHQSIPVLFKCTNMYLHYIVRLHV